MIATLLSFTSGLLTLLILDGAMIWFVILPTFKKYIPSYLNADMNYIAAILFYLFYIAILFLLVILPGYELRHSLFQVWITSMLFGFGAYMTYELTSMSAIRGWSWNMVFIDLTWGTVLTGIIGLAMYIIYRYFI